MDLATVAFADRAFARWPAPPGVPCAYPDLVGAGINRSMIRALLREGLVRRLLKGVYVDTQTPDSVSLRAEALRLVCPPDCVVVDRHAGWLHGAQMALAPGEHITLRPLSIFRPSGHGRLRNPVSNSGERHLLDEDVTEVNGVAVTTAMRTAWDLGRVRWPDEAIAGMDSVAGLDAFDKDEFVAGIERFRGQRWVRTLRAIGPHVDGRSESPPESILRLRCHWIGLHLQPQVEVWEDGRFLARLDLGDDDRRCGVEYDGAEWHSTPEQILHDRNRRREVADAGWLLEVLRKENLFGRSADVDTRLRIFKQRVESAESAYIHADSADFRRSDRPTCGATAAVGAPLRGSRSPQSHCDAL